jgi:uncharacterized protein YjdB
VKKFFSFTIAIFMLISMVSLVGCNGLWDFDDDDDVTLMPVKFNFVGKLAFTTPPTPTNSIRAAAIVSPTVYTGNVYYEGDSSTALNKNPITVDNVGSFTADFTAIDGKTFYIVFTSSAGGLKLYRYFNKTKADMDNYDASNPAIVNEETTAVGIILQSDSSKKYGIDVKEGDADVDKLVQTITGMDDVSTNPLTVPVDTVAIDQTGSISLEFGKTTTLTATVSPTYATDKIVTWSSSNTAVATVDSAGVVTAGTTAGTANITATAGGVNSTAIVVNVTAANVAVTGVTLNKTTTSIPVGGTDTLVATVAPATASNKAVTWTSSDAAVATVDASGKVTGVKAGTATITVTTADGSKTDTCVVTVTAAATTTTVNLSASVTTGTTTGMQIVLTGMTTAEETALENNTTIKVTLPAGGTNYDFTVDKTISGLVTGVKVIMKVNTTNLATFDSFNSLTFSEVLPAGTTVSVTQGGTEVATGQ